MLVALMMASFAGAPYANAAPANARTSARFTVTAMSASSVVMPGNLTIRGKVAPIAPGQTVTLQVLRRNSWVNVATARLSSSSTYTFSYRFVSPGMNRVRVLKGASVSTSAATVGPGASRFRSVTVLRWRYLTALPAIITSFTSSWEDQPATVDGKLYPKSIVEYVRAAQSTDYGAAYNLGRKCTMLDATVGIADGDQKATPATRLSAWVEADGAEIWRATLALGSPVKQSLDISGSLRIYLNSLNLSDDNAVGTVWGDAKVLCSS